MRTSTINRRTAETDIRLVLDLDGGGKSEIDTGCGFLNHMLTLFARHGRFDLTVKCVGDTDVDDHHTVEDIGICLGLAFEEALGDMGGIVRYGNTLLPMDEALIWCRNSGWASCARPTSRSTSGSWPAKTAITSSRAPSSPRPEACGPPAPSIRH